MTKINNNSVTGYSGWEKLYLNKHHMSYPDECVVRFINKNFPINAKRKNIKILDSGCGTGRHSIFLKKEGFDVYGFDGSKTAVKVAEKWANKEGLKIDLRTAEIVSLPYEDDFFDAVLDISSLTHNKKEDIKRGIKEMERVLKKGGLIFSLCPSRESMNYGVGQEIEENTFLIKNKIIKNIKTSLVYHYFEPKEIRELWSGFSNINIEKQTRTYDNMTKSVTEFLVTIIK